MTVPFKKELKGLPTLYARVVMCAMINQTFWSGQFCMQTKDSGVDDIDKNLKQISPPTHNHSLDLATLSTLQQFTNTILKPNDSDPSLLQKIFASLYSPLQTIFTASTSKNYYKTTDPFKVDSYIHMSDITLCEASRGNTNDEVTHPNYQLPDPKERIWYELCESLGWYWPPLSPKTDENYARSRVLVHFGRLNSLTQSEILKFNQRSNGENYNPNRIERYWTTWHLRAIFLEAIEWAVNGYSSDPDLLIFRDFTSNSELTWLDLNHFRSEKLLAKQIDFPVGIHFYATDPLQGAGPSLPHLLKAQVSKIDLDKSPSQGFWSIGFQRTPYPTHEINFSHSEAYPSVHVPHHLGKIGEIWVEHGKAGVENRILFRKTVAEDDLSILIWPQYQPAHLDQKRPLTQLPRIPAYADEIVEITVRFDWASQTSEDSSIWRPNHYNWPNPTTRYSHYVKRPITMPLERSVGSLEDEKTNSTEIDGDFLRKRIKTLTPESKETDSNSDHDHSPSQNLSSSRLKRSIDQVNRSEKKQIKVVEKIVSPRLMIRLPSSIESRKVDTDTDIDADTNQAQPSSRRKRSNSGVSVTRRTSLPRASKTKNTET
ncbi:uncharacterized protein MELLADRAFT_66115 [Melampsora larici-populina 98AG31]|uniref:Uncharacterized protein n=1 Tax=Melampsora larici-populina (strain 98AG31 / pathotype 3-4-7) TaxID=747676 RepID=F4RXY0_MELLP|nr:uncharacterized protein MELLADRAFT_66115 [Melampsora larici-populina 98AG31]EGG02810.1 hypothetical protein MELLADRAFT_66115 [Melampsora larici-populina 98AG31]